MQRTEPPPGGPRIGSLFSGYGGLEQGVQAVLGGSTAWVSDIDPGACRILAHRYPDVPNLGDVSAVDWTASSPWTSSPAGSPARTCPTPAPAAVSAPAPAPVCGPAWPTPSTTSAHPWSSQRT
jgi:hypothetical protein